jgi:hypothetical protein
MPRVVGGLVVTEQTQRLVGRIDPAIERTLERDDAGFAEVKRRLEAMPPVR